MFSRARCTSETDLTVLSKENTMRFFLLGLLFMVVGWLHIGAVMLNHDLFGAYTYHISLGGFLFWKITGALCVNRAIRG